MRFPRLFPFGLPLPCYAPDGAGSGGDGQQQQQDGGQQQQAADGQQQQQQQQDGGGDKGGEKQGDITNALGAGGADDGKAAATPADWPADWREKLATGADGKVDAKRLEQLKRMPAPTDLGKSWFDAQGKIRAGQALADEPMPEDAEKAKEWRKARDIPEDAAGYTIPDEVKAKLGDDDKPVIASYTEQMHKLGMPQKFVAEGVKWYTGLVEQQAEQQAKDDKEAALSTRDALREEWGADFKANATIAERYAKEAIPGVNWFEARLPDGRALGNVPEVVKALTRFGLMEYGDVAFAGGEQARQTSDRLAELTKIMQTDYPKWEKSPELRSEHFKLTEAKLAREARTGKAT